MKKLITLAGVAFLTCLTAYSQVEIRLDPGTGNDISGTTYTMGVSGDGSHAVIFNVKNISGSATDLSVKRLRINTMPDWYDNLSWAPNPDPNFEGHCYSYYPENPWTTPTALTIADQSTANLWVVVQTTGGGCSYYRYYVMDGANTIDSIDLEVCYASGMDEEQKDMLSVYPNPADDLLTVNTTGINGAATLRITDLAGKVVYDKEASGIQKVNVSDFKNGIYLVTLLENETATRTKRIVVKH